MKAVIGDLERMKIEGAAQVQRAEKIAMETEQLNLQQHEQVCKHEKMMCLLCPPSVFTLHQVDLLYVGGC